MSHKRLQKVFRKVKSLCKRITRRRKKKTTKQTEKWRRQVENACFLVENVRLSHFVEASPQVHMDRSDELSQMKKTLQSLRAQRQMLKRALEPLELPVQRLPSDSFDQTRCDLTLPPPMTPLLATSESVNSTFDHSIGEFSSNGFNSYFVAF